MRKRRKIGIIKLSDKNGSLQENVIRSKADTPSQNSKGISYIQYPLEIHNILFKNRPNITNNITNSDNSIFIFGAYLQYEYIIIFGLSQDIDCIC